MENGIFLLRNYGKIKINIKTIMDKKSITKH